MASTLTASFGALVLVTTPINPITLVVGGTSLVTGAALYKLSTYITSELTQAQQSCKRDCEVIFQKIANDSKLRLKQATHAPHISLEIIKAKLILLTSFKMIDDLVVPIVDIEPAVIKQLTPGLNALVLNYNTELKRLKTTQETDILLKKFTTDATNLTAEPLFKQILETTFEKESFGRLLFS